MAGQQDQGSAVGSTAGIHMGAADLELFYRDTPAFEQGSYACWKVMLTRITH